MNNQVLYWSLLAGCAAYAFWRGGGAERAGMAVLAVGSLLSTGAVITGIGSYDSVQIGVLAVDVAVLALFLAIALRADRFWPLWVTGIHLLGLMAHLTKALALELHPWAYAVAQGVGGYAIMALIALGAMRHHQRRIRANVGGSSTSC